MQALLFGLIALPALVSAKALDPASLRDQALKDEVAWHLVEGLTTEVGPRLAGSASDERARHWAVAKLTELGFANVRIEPFEINGWARGVEQGEILAPFPQRLVLTALGGSGATPPEGLVGEVVGFGSLAELEAAPDSAINGKIVFIWHRMSATQDGSSYRAFGPVRMTGPALAASKGAVAVVVRSVGTDHHRLAHAGATYWKEAQTPIPAAALSVPDAEQLERILGYGKPVQLKLVLTPRFTGRTTIGNVVAEIPGRDPSAGIVLVGGHLDSWDLGTGAIDDAAGLAIMTAAARIVARAGKPLRTIRVVWFGSEETGEQGGAAYYNMHGKEKHALAAESDSGADRVWRFDTSVRDPSILPIQRLGALLAPLGISQGANDAQGGADVRLLVKSGAFTILLRQDMSHYFDIHHTADDTLDKIDPTQLQQNVAAWTALLAVAADAPDWPENDVNGSKTPPIQQH
jgi:hypothetical protein